MENAITKTELLLGASREFLSICPKAMTARFTHLTSFSNGGSDPSHTNCGIFLWICLIQFIGPDVILENDVTRVGVYYSEREGDVTRVALWGISAIFTGTWM